MDTLSFANVAASDGTIGAVSGEDGSYSINLPQAGEYSLTASYVGYEKMTRLIRVGSGERVRVDFDLKQNFAMDEVVVTGTMKPTYLLDSPVKVEVVSASQVETYMPASASSVVEAVQLVGGVQEVVACGVCYTNTISINGLPGAYTAVLMDGTPMYGNLASVYGLNGIPSVIVDRIEVIKGPVSTLYGSEAVAGVINVITRNPENQPILSVDLMGTSHRESFGNIAFAPRIGNTSGYIGLNYAYVNDFQDINDDGFGDAINLDRISLFTKWNVGRRSGKEFSIAGKYYYEDRRNGVEDYLRDRAYRQLRGSDSVYGESIYTRRAELFGTYALNVDANLRIDYSVSHHIQDSYYGSDYYEAQQTIGFANLLWNFSKRKHDVLVGVTARAQAYDDNTIATEITEPDGTTVNNPDNQFIPGVFVQDEIKFNKKWTLLAGGRLDHYSAHGLILTPRLSAKFSPSSWTTYRLNFGTGFRIVNLFAEDHAFITGQREVVIQEDLLPERSYNVAFNTSTVFTAGNGSGSIDFDAFYTYFTNKIIPDYSDPDKIIYANSNGNAQTVGGGINASYGFAFPLRMSAGFNVQVATESEEIAPGEFETRNIEFSPVWSSVITVNYNWEKIRTVFGYTANITGPMTLPEVYDLDETGTPTSEPRPTTSTPFSLHNFQVTTRINRSFSVYCGIQNLFNYRQTISPLIGYNDPNAQAGFSDFFDTSYAYAPNHGREFYLGIKWDLQRSGN